MINFPRQLIYQNRQDIEDYITGCELNKAVYDFIGEKLPHFHPRMLGIFNDAYCLCIMIAGDINFRHNKKYYFRKLEMESSPEACSIALSVAYVILAFLSKKTMPVLEFLAFYHYDLLEPLSGFCDDFCKRGIMYDLDLRPCPCCADDGSLEHLDWRSVTDGFDRVNILKVVDLWHRKEDKLKVLARIQKAMCPSGTENGVASPRFMDWLRRTIGGTHTFDLHPRMLQVQETENRCTEGVAGVDDSDWVRKVVDYAKGQLNWEEAKPFRDMLNHLLRGSGDENLFEMVDEIEKHFHQKEQQRGLHIGQVNGPVIGSTGACHFTNPQKR